MSPNLEARRKFFLGRNGNRYWWHRKIQDAYVPDVYATLTDAEWSSLAGWFEETDAKTLIGECQVPAIAWLTSFVSANDVSRIVQLGSYAGYSALLLGWALRRIGKKHGLVAVDIDRPSCDFTSKWVKSSGLSDYVMVHCGDSADPALRATSIEYLGGAPQLVFIDSSHQYAHTLRELDLWYEIVAPGGMITMHDTSEFAASFDSSGDGGVKRALDEWKARSNANAFSLAFSPKILEQNKHVYLDGCGLGVVIKDH